MPPHTPDPHSQPDPSAADSQAEDPTPGDPSRYRLFAFGEFPIESPDGQTLIQVLDAKAAESMVDTFDGDLLVDYEHFSHQPDQQSRAAGWITGIEARDDGLFATIRWSAQGQADIEGAEYRYVSPEFDAQDAEELGQGRLRPRRLAGAALTNRPNIPGQRPLLNRAPLPHLHAQLAQLKAERDRLLHDLVERDLRDHEARIADREAARRLLLAHRADTLAALGADQPSPDPRPPLFNRSQTRACGLDLHEAAHPADDPRAKARAAEVRRRAHTIQREHPGMGFTTAWRQAESEVPAAT